MKAATGSRSFAPGSPLLIALVLVLGYTCLCSTMGVLAKPASDGPTYPGFAETLQYLIDAGVDNPAEVPDGVLNGFASKFPLPDDSERAAAFRAICKESGIHQPEDLTPLPPEQIWQLHAKLFVPRLSSAAQVSEVHVRGWDPKSKKEIVGSSRPQNDARLSCIEEKLKRLGVTEIADLTPKQFAEVVADCDIPAPSQFAAFVDSWLVEQKVGSLQKLTDQQKADLEDAFMASL